jgi:hypothetical protein
MNPLAAALPGGFLIEFGPIYQELKGDLLAFKLILG